MSGKFRWLLLSAAVIAALMTAVACGGDDDEDETPTGTATTPAGLTGKLEIFSWWTTGGEAAGLEALYDLYPGACSPNVEIVNATVAGGAGSNARQVLTTRMLGGDPPGSFQVHMGEELTDTWVRTGYMESLKFLYDQEGWDEVFPKGVLDIISYNGEPYSVPVNIHRANVLWYNKTVFAENNLQPPTTFDEFFAVADALKAKGITPLAIGDVGVWSSVQIFESVLIGTLGPDDYIGLWNGKTDWDSPKVTQAIETFKKMLSYANSDHSSLSWDQANDLVIKGDAGMTIMGDWVDADNLAKEFKDSGWVPAPGNAGIYDALSDTFGLPKDAPNRDAVICWLKLVGSKEGQESFNTLKGSICARDDCDAAKFDTYLQSAMKDWNKDTIVPSLAHGAAASQGWLEEIQDATTVFITQKDVGAFQKLLVDAAKNAAN